MKKLTLLLLIFLPCLALGQDRGIVILDQQQISSNSNRGIICLDCGTSIPDTIHANEYSFIPSNTGDENILAWDNMPVAKNIVIDSLGVYEISNTLYLKSSTSYHFNEGQTLQKETGSNFSHVIGNIGMLSNSRNAGIKLYGNGLALNVNGIDTYSLTNTAITPVLRLRGVFQFYKTDNFIVDDVYMHDTLITNQFIFCFVDCSNGIISNLDIRSDKDATDFIGCSDIILKDSKLYSRDDAIFIGMGYYSTNPVMKDCERILIDNIEMGSAVSVAGYGCRFFADSWGNWESGKSYAWNEACISSGKIYMKENETGIVSSVAPTHSSGYVTGADGITWWYVQNGTKTSCDVRDITLNNIRLKTVNRQAFQFGTPTNIARGKGSYTINNVVFDSIDFPANFASTFIKNEAHCDTVIVNNINEATSIPLVYSRRDSTITSLNEFIIDSSVFTINTAIYNYENTLFSFKELYIRNSTLNIASATNILSTYNGVMNNFRTLNSELISTGRTIINIKPHRWTGNNIFTNTIFTAINYLGDTDSAGVSSTFTLDNCEFKTSIGRIMVVDKASCNIDYISTGTKYIEPSFPMFYTDQAVGGLSIDLSSSEGVITSSNIKSTNTVVIALDLPIATPVVADAAGLALNEVGIQFTTAMDASVIPSISSFAVSDKIVDSVWISGSIVTVRTTTNFINTDVVTVSYTRPVTNKLRGVNLGEIASFSNLACINVTASELVNGDFSNGTTNWTMVLGGAMNVSNGIATMDRNGTAYSIFENTQWGVQVGTYNIVVRITENTGGKDFVTGFLKAADAGDNNVTITAIPVGISTRTVASTANSVSYYIRGLLDPLPNNMKIAYVYIKKQ